MANLLDLIDGLNNSEKKQRQRQLDYWRDREETQKQHNITDLNEYNRELDKIYATMITDCQNQINDWYMRYATKEGISIADAKKRVSTADQKYYAERAKEYVANKDFSDKANREMRLYNLTMKVNRMELLKANLGMAMTGSYSDIEKLTGEFLDKKTLEELKRQAVILGKGVEDSEKRANDIVNASFKNATFSDRLWADMDSLRQSINVQVQRSLIRGLNPVEIARGFMPELRNDVRKARYVTERLARTEMSRVLTDAQMDSFKANGYDEYMIICERTACPLCRPFDGQHFPIDEMEVGYNASPFHPSCLCSQAPYMDRDELEQMIREIEAERGETEEDRRQAVINRRKQEWKERQAMREAQARAQSNKQTPKTIKSNDTAEVSRLLTEALEEAYTNHIKTNSMKASTIEEMKEYNASPVKANFGKLNPESASAVADTVSKLMKQYDTPLQAVRIMTKEELLGSMNSFAYVYHDYTIDSATMLINQSKFRDFEKHTARIVELSEKGYCAKIKPELASQYVATHEFGHSLINMEQPLSKKTNWLNADYDKVKTARSEIKTIYKKYMDDVGTLDAKCKELDNKYFNDYLIEQKMTAEEAEKLRAEYIKTSDQLEKVKISDYSMSCIDEFVAESFANSKLGVNQNAYAEEVVSVLDKYFGRES